jgi:hypothetical protein
MDEEDDIDFVADEFDRQSTPFAMHQPIGFDRQYSSVSNPGRLGEQRQISTATQMTRSTAKSNNTSMIPGCLNEEGRHAHADNNSMIVDDGRKEDGSSGKSVIVLS